MELIKITKDNIRFADNVIELVATEWGAGFSSSKEEKLAKLKASILAGNKFPQVYLLQEKGINIGSFMIVDRDLKGSELSPWLACVVIDKNYRGKGYGKVMLEYIKNIIEDNFDEIYLTTDMVGFYEKIGFTLLNIIENNGKNNRLYCKKNCLKNRIDD